MFHGRFPPIGLDEAGYARVAGSIGQRGLDVNVEVWLHPNDHEQYRFENRALPLPQRISGFIDTGAQVTCISTGLVQSLSLEPVADAQLYTADGDRATKAYAVTAHVGWNAPSPPDPIPLVVYAASPSGVDMLIGLDVIRHGRLILNGPLGEYELFLPRTARPVP